VSISVNPWLNQLFGCGQWPRWDYLGLTFISAWFDFLKELKDTQVKSFNPSGKSETNADESDKNKMGIRN